MANSTVIVVDQSLVWAPNDLNPALSDAYKYTQTFANAAARTVSKDTQSEVYFNKMTLELSRVGWNITQSDKLTYHIGSSGSYVPSSVVSTLLDSYLSPEQQKQTKGLLDAIKNPDNSIKDFLTFWWSKSSPTDASKTSMSFGPLQAYLGSPDVTVIWYYFNYHAEGWRSLFVEQKSSDLQVDARFLRMNLNMGLYNSVKNELITKLSGKITDHVKEETLDL
jgi:hypothetical protein